MQLNTFRYFGLSPDAYQLIATVISKGKPIAVCDGSFHPKDCLRTAAFLMVASKKDKKALIGANWSLGTLGDQSPYRNELTEVDSILSVLEILVKYFKIKKRAITIVLTVNPP